MLFTNLLVALPLLGGAFSAPTPILNDVLAPVTGIVSPVAGVSNGIGAVQGNSVDVVSIVTNLKDVLTGTIVGANLDVIDDVITTVDTCASVLNNAYTDLGVFTDVTAPVSVHDLINIGKRDAADTPDLDVVSDLVAEVIELVEKLVADLTDEIELDETVNRLLTTLDNNLFILLGSVDQLLPGVLEAVGDLLKDINLDEVLTKVTDLLTPLTAGANIL